MGTGYYLLDNPQRYTQCRRTRRNGAKATGTIILHDAEGGTDLHGADSGAENVANYIRTRTTPGSYHRLVDRDTRIKMAPIDCEVWHCVPSNNWSVGICVAWTKADLPRMTYAQRRSYYEPFAREVLDVRAEFASRGIHVPIDRFLSRSEVMARKPGISTHSRTDPGRRSDPFGTGSTYEAEFLAVLNELAGSTTSTTPEEDMTPEQAKKLDDIDAKLTRLAQLAPGLKGVGSEGPLWPALNRVLDGFPTVATNVELLGRLRPGKSGVGHQGDLWPLVAAALNAPRGDGALDPQAAAEAIAEALPDDIAERVADVLATRLSKNG